MLVIGADPGITGALAFFSVGNLFDDSLEVADMPALKRSKRNEVAVYELAGLIRYWIDTVGPPIHAYVEQVSAAPIQGRRQGTVSMFGFGRSFGSLIGVLAGLKVPITLVTPQEWRKAMRVGNGKDAARIRVGELHPELIEQVKRVKDHGRADAILLAAYGMHLQSKSNVRIPESRD